MKRRDFLKSSILLTGALGLTSRAFNLLPSAQATTPLDAKITRQDYTKDIPPKKTAAKKKYDSHIAKLAKIKAGTKPNCKNCKQYKPIAAHPGWGKCAMVGATGKPGKLVAQEGWCKVWMVNKKVL